MKPKEPTAREVLDAVERSEFDDAVERILAMTPAERRKELEQGGYAPGELEAGADALYEDMRRDLAADRARQVEREARARSMRPAARTARLRWLAAAVVVAGGGGALLYAELRGGTPAARPPAPAPSAPAAPLEVPEAREAPLVAASTLRRQASAACEAQEWEACLDALERARELDPVGDGAEDVVRLRRNARDALSGKK